jgi:hypothetical protein
MNGQRYTNLSNWCVDVRGKMNDISMPTYRGQHEAKEVEHSNVSFKLGASDALEYQVDDLLGLAVLGLGHNHVVADLWYVTGDGHYDMGNDHTPKWDLRKSEEPQHCTMPCRASEAGREGKQATHLGHDGDAVAENISLAG